MIGFLAERQMTEPLFFDSSHGMLGSASPKILTFSFIGYPLKKVDCKFRILPAQAVQNL
jgi:hypothetical protein